MQKVRILKDEAECEAVWRQNIPEECVWDLWEVRDCFHRHYRRPLHFLLAEEEGRVGGLMPLSWIEECRSYGYFPGEVWNGKTWIEQNRVPARDGDAMASLLMECPSEYHVRYLVPSEVLSQNGAEVDEIGYLFYPPRYDYDIENYFQEFSHKSAKRIKREVAALETRGAEFRYDTLSDFEELVKLSLGRFGASSYFHDERFRESFQSLAYLLEERGWLRITTVLIEGEVAAVDLGCVFGNSYTMLGGGTHGGYPGVAKLINLHHMRRACEERYEHVDFLCGDFSWKTLFHLAPRPLYLLSSGSPAAENSGDNQIGSVACDH